jgi:capsular polysaccharide biosynthesis protein
MAVVFLVAAAISAALAVRDLSRRDWIASSQLFVSAVSGSSGPTLTGGRILSYEAEARQIAVDLSQVASGRSFATSISHQLTAALSPAAVQSSITAASNARVITLTAAERNRNQAIAIARLADGQLLGSRAFFVGPSEARRSEVTLVSPPVISRASVGHILLTFGLRILLAALVAVTLGLAWDYLDDSIHSQAEVERWLDAPVLSRING